MSKVSWVPDQKIWAGGLAGILTWLVVFIAGRFGLDVPLEVQAFIPLLLGYVTSYLVPQAVRDVVSRVDNSIVRLATADPENPTTAIVVPRAVVESPHAIAAAVSAGREVAAETVARSTIDGMTMRPTARVKLENQP